MGERTIKRKIGQHIWHHQNRNIRLGVGCAWLGRGQTVTDRLDEELRILDSCYQAGLRYFDTSRAYGDSELVLGEWIRQIDRQSIFLATKAAFPYRESDGFEQFKRCFYESFDRLATDHIDLFQIHDTNHFQVCQEKVIPFLLERKKEGLIDYIGMGTRSQVAHSQAILSGVVDSSLSYLDYNLLKLSARKTIEYARSNQTAFINASVFLYGIFKGDDPLSSGQPVYGSALAFYQFARKMKELCLHNQIDPIAASLQFSLLNPDIDLTLVGIKRMDNLVSTLQALDVCIHPEQWAAIFKLQGECPNIEVEDELNYR